MKNPKILGILMLVGSITVGLIVSANNPAVAEKPGECICTHLYDPVCIFETGQMFTNACRAQCAGFTPDEYGPCNF